MQHVFGTSRAVELVVETGQRGLGELRRVPVLEGHGHRAARGAGPDVAGYEVHLAEVQGAAILLFGVVAARHVHHVVVDVLAHHKPRAAAEAQALALSDGVEPVSAVLAYLAPGLYLDDGAGTLAKVAADEVAVVDFAQKADALRVFAHGVGHVLAHRYLAYLCFGQVADGEGEVAQLVVGDLCQEVGLVLDGVDGGGKPFRAIGVGDGGGVVAGGGEVELVAPALLEEAELDDFVAHHIRVGRQAAADGAQGVLHDVLPVLVVQRHHVEGQPVAARYQAADVDVLFGRAVVRAVVDVHGDADVEQVHVVALLDEAMYGHGAVHASGY